MANLRNTTITGTLSASGAVTFASTLGVTGAVTFSSTLGVTGLATLASVAISGGNINATVIGGTTPAAGAFTTLSSSGAATLASLVVTAGATVGGSAVLVTTAIGNTVQAFSTNLVTFAGIAPSANIVSLLGAADYAAVRSQLLLVVGTNVQAFDANTTILGNSVTGSGGSIVLAEGASLTAVAGFGLRDTSAAFDVTMVATSTTALTAGRTLTLDLNNASRTFKLSANLEVAATATISGINTGDQDLSGLAAKHVTLNTQTDSYTLVLADDGKLVRMNKATANTLTVPANASVAFAIGTEIAVVQWGAGTTSIAPDGGVTIRSADGLLDLAAQYATAALVKVDTNEWLLTGALA